MEFIIKNKTLIKFAWGHYHDEHEYTLTIPEGVERIAKGADDEVILRQYRTLVLPSSLKEIEEGAIFQTRMLENIVLAEGSKLHYEGGCLYSPDYKKLLMSATKGIDNINIKDGCEIIYECAFIFRWNIKTVHIPNSVTYIGRRCFLWCDKLNKVVLSNQINKIYSGTFVNCESLAELYIPDSVLFITDDSIPETVKLIFHSGSVAEEYAIKNNMNFVKLLY